MREIIRWVYTRQILAKALESSAAEMLDAARHFQLWGLVRETERELVNQLSSNNVFRFIEIADRVPEVRTATPIFPNPKNDDDNKTGKKLLKRARPARRPFLV